METRDDKIFKKYKSAKNAVSREIKKIVRNEQQGQSFAVQGQS